jgi:pSer/pThr/pTyr-binding forkhead associated (FHA) protein
VPYIVVKTNGQEIDRRELTGDITIGRAAECDVVVRDILLSRRHCRLQREGAGWMLCDLQSKNGTVLNGERLIGPRMLRDHDVLRLGRWKIVFHLGIPEEDLAERVTAPARPADPGDSLAGTLSGFTLLLPGEGEIPQNMPSPQPRPRDPPAFNQEELQTLLSGIASSSWDSVYAEARQPLRNISVTNRDDDTSVRRVRPHSPMDLSLQVNPASPAVPDAARPSSMRITAMRLTLPRLPRWKPQFRPSLHAVVAALWIVTLLLLNLSHKPLPRQAFGDQMPMPDLSSPIVPMNDSVTELAGDEQAKTAHSPPDAPAEKVLHIDSPALKATARASAMYLPLMW